TEAGPAGIVLDASYKVASRKAGKIGVGAGREASKRPRSAIAPHQLFESGAPGRELLVRDAVQRHAARLVECVELRAAALVDVDQSGDVLVLLELLLDEGIGRAAIGG